MNCDRFRAQISGDRVGPATRSHLVACGPCSAWAERLGRVRRQAPVLVGAPPAGLADRVLTGLAESEPVLRTTAPPADRAPSEAAPPGPADLPAVHSGGRTPPAFWRPAVRKFTASLTAAAVVAGAVLLTMDRSEDPQLLLASAAQALDDPSITYRYEVEGRAEARFAPPELAPSPLHVEPPGPGPQGGSGFQLPPVPGAPPLPDGPGAGAGARADVGPGGMGAGLDAFARGLEGWSQGMAEHFGGYADELARWAEGVAATFEAYAASLAAAAERHAAEWEAYRVRVEAELAGLEAELAVAERERYGRDVPWTPTEVTIEYRGEGEARGRAEERAAMDYRVRTPVEVRRRVEVIGDGERTYARDPERGAWGELGADVEVRPSGLSGTATLDEVLALLRRAPETVERLESGSRPERGYRFERDGVSVHAWLDAEGRLREVTVAESASDGVAERESSTTYRFEAYGEVRVDATVPAGTVPLDALPPEQRPAVGLVGRVEAS